jgi:colanic acid biosynthesis glycosyl transferase WcaI
MKNKKILIIGINYSPELTGIGKYTGELGRFMAGEGAEVQVVTAFPYYPQWKVASGYGNRWFHREQWDGASLLRCPSYVPAKPTGKGRILQDLSFFLSSWMAVTLLLLRGKRYDMIFTVVPSFLSAFTGYWFKLFRPKTRFVVHVMDLQIDAAEELGMIRSGWLMDMLRKAEAFVLRRADIVSTISLGMQRRLQKKGIRFRKILLFPLWVNFEQIYACEPDRFLLESLQLPPDRRIILYSGAIGEKQGVDLIPQVAQALAKDMPDLYFVICGTGPYLEKLKLATAAAGIENVGFIPLQPVQVFNQLLNKAWMHLVVQRNAGAELFLPSKITNILAVGGLALVTASPGSTLHRIIHSQEAGLVVPESDPSSMQDAIRTLSRNPVEVARLKLNASMMAREKYDMGKIIRGFFRDAGW